MDNKFYMLITAICLLFLSIFTYLLHFLIFKDFGHIFSYFLLHLAFLPIDVLFISLIIEKILEYQEKRKKLEKLYILFGCFFNGIGEELLKIILKADIGDMSNYLKISADWNNKKNKLLKKSLMSYNYDIDMEKINLYDLKSLLINNRDFLIRILENPILLEHEEFTELLLAVFHLMDELHRRKNLENLPKSDLEHLKNDILRVYKLLVIVWISYLMHLKDSYPYLFSLHMRACPVNPESSVIINDIKKNEKNKLK
ncbi:hypothetical protein [Methanothermococcus okinawensis]|uniref:Uncharacterized protein n=1 Tax=Methanothermococcus okinawensis (strain DSM 14208 / JCM 11175 / IH1) TaxID=647113 RepID=F8AJX3_METOI|nr:hypothetical protein [Methanothermococcus okinawensis]AEH07329.1 hypothetical protein Metok_1364 [Methanothermococcus okinawensis IH1]